jgi:SRSO17 transposase
VGVFLAYASCRGQAFIDRELYLPEEWASDEQRRERARVPEEVGMRTKPELAKETLLRALEAGVKAEWVLADSVYGDTRRLGMLLEERGSPTFWPSRARLTCGLASASTASAKYSRSSGKEGSSLKIGHKRASSASQPGTARRVRASTTGRGCRSIRPCRKASRDGSWCADPSRIRRSSPPTGLRPRRRHARGAGEGRGQSLESGDRI